MPTVSKKKDEDKNQPEKEVRRDALGNVIESDVPELKDDVDVSGSEPEPTDKPEDKVEVKPEPEPSKDSKTDTSKEEPGDVPPDLVPDKPATEEDDAPQVKSDETTAGEADEDQSESEAEPEPEPKPKSDPKPDGEDDKDSDNDDATPYDDATTDKVIDEIVAKEGDAILAAQDAAAGKANVKPKRHGFVRFLRSKWTQYVVLLVLLGGIAGVAAVPLYRYYVLNAMGVRSSSSLVVVDSTTQLPLKGVHVSIGNQKADTDSDGRAKLSDLKHGPTRLTIEQIGFEKVNQDVVIGWGSNPLGNFALKATGVQYVIEVRDYLSEKPIKGVEATDGEVTAISDKDGKITLTLTTKVVAKDGISLSKNGYRAEAVTINEDPEKPTKATMVLARKAVFATKQSGKYDLYKSDIDGQNREVLLPGTGHENSNISLAVSPDGKRAALVSTRDNKRDSDGFLLSSLVLVNVDGGEKVTIAEGAQIQLIDWVGSRLVFQVATSDSEDSNRHTVISHDYAKNSRVQLVSANKLNAVVSAQGSIYYSVGADESNPSLQTGLFKVGIDGKGKQRVVEDELLTVLRSSYGTLSLQTVGGAWSAYDIESGAKTQVSAPDNLTSRLYADNGDRSRSLRVSQGSLMSLEVASGKETTVHAQSGLTYPVQWISPTAAIFRVSNGSETADYAVDVTAGSPHKVSDVAATYGPVQAQ